MTLEEAFKDLLSKWDTPEIANLKILDPEKGKMVKFTTKYRTYKSRFLNISGKHTKQVGPDTMRKMLEIAGYKEKWSKPK